VPTGDPDAWRRPPFAGEVADGRIHGRGACDMKAGMIAALWAVRALRAADVRLRGDVVLASVIGEEDGGLGSFATLDRGWRADACIVPEPTDLDIIAACAGALTFRLRVRGVATHAARRAEGVSAIDKFVPVLQALHDLEQRRHESVDDLLSRWPLAHPLSIGTIRGGDWASSVPDLLVAEGRMGVALDEPIAEARRALEETVAEACEQDPWLRDHPVGVEWWGGQFASGRLAADSDLGVRLGTAHCVATGRAAPETYGAPYGSDLRLLAGIGGIPTVLYGPGDAVVAHAPDEYVALPQVEATARTLAAAAIDICGVP
jgi:acetylornithine deacetylase